MSGYLVPAGYGEATHIDKKSRFIGRIWHVPDESEALYHIEQTRARHRDAAHNVYAYILRDGGIMRFSDDGEPGGTSGMPTLNVFRKGGVFDVCCVVTRYFGGILLGSGGLVRAYSAAASLALEAAGLAEMRLWRVCEASCPYPLYERARRELERCGAVIEAADFGADVVLSALVLPEAEAEAALVLSELSAGAIRLNVTGETHRGVKIEKNFIK